MGNAYSELAEQFGNLDVIKHYVKGRPGYTQGPINWILEQQSSKTKESTLFIAEAGVGTGLFTQTIVTAANAKTQAPFIARIYGFDPSDQMCLATRQNPALRNAISNGLLIIKNGRLQKTGLADHSIDIMIAAQTLHWATQSEGDFQASVVETMRVLKDGGSVFAVYNMPVADKKDSFTNDLNALLANKCPYPYYQSMASGHWEKFLGKGGKSNLGRFFKEVAGRGSGKVLQTIMENPTRYVDADTIRCFVFSNAFIHGAAVNRPELKDELAQSIAGLFERYDNGSGVFYGNKTLVIGAIDLHL